MAIATGSTSKPELDGASNVVYAASDGNYKRFNIKAEWGKLKAPTVGEAQVKP